MNQQLFISLSANINQSASAISDINKQITSLSTKIKNISMSVDLDIDSNSINSLKTQMSSLENKIEPIKIDIEYDTSKAESISKSVVNLDEMASSMSSTSNASKSMSENLVLMDSNTKVLRDSTSLYNKELSNQNMLFKDSKYSLDVAMQSFLTYQVVTEIFYHAKAAVSSMVEEIVELDAAMVELSKVTDLTDSQMQQFLEDSYESASKVAKTGTEMIEASTEFAKAGYDTSDAQMLGEVALMYTNIADEAISAAESSEFIIAQMKAFNITAEESMHIIDAVNEVSNNYAVSSADIANNLGKSSAVMANAGNSMEELIGLMTAGTEITRDASKVSNGLKTITLRMQGMTDEGEDSLELIAQMDELYSKLGVSVYQADGSLKNTYELLETLAPIYKDASVELKAYITEVIAGKNQAQVAASILNNFSTAIEATSTAMDSTGSAAAENEKAIDSVAGSFNKLKSSWEEMSNSFVNSDMIKYVLNLSSSLVDLAGSPLGSSVIKFGVLFAAMRGGLSVISFLGDKFKGLKDTLSSVNSVMTLTNSKKDLMLAKSKLMVAQQNIENMSLEELQDVLNSAGIGVENLTDKEQAQNLINKALTSSTILLNLAISAGTALIMFGVSAYQKYQQAKKEAIEESLNSADATNQEIESLSDYISQVEYLSEVLNSETSTYDDLVGAKSELATIQQELIDNYGAEAKGIDLVTGSVSEQIEELKKLKQERATDWLNDNTKEIGNAEDDIYGENTHSRRISFSGSDLGDSTLDDIENIIEQYKIGHMAIQDGVIEFSTSSVDNSKQALDSLIEYLDDNKNNLIIDGEFDDESWNELRGKLQSELNNITDKFGDSYSLLEEKQQMLLDAAGYDEFVSQLQELANAETLTTKNIHALASEFPGLSDALDNGKISIDDLKKSYQNATVVFDNLMNNDYGSEFSESLENMIYSGDLTIEKLEDLIETNESFSTSLAYSKLEVEDFADYLSKYTGTMEDFDTAVNNFAENSTSSYEALSILSSAVSEFNENGEFSVDTLSTLSSTMITLSDGTNASLLSMLNFTENGLVANTDALYNNIDALRQTAIATIQESAAQQILQLTSESADTSMGGMSDAVENAATSLEKSLSADAQKIASNLALGASYDKVNAAAANEGLDTSKWAENEEEITNIINSSNDAIEALMNTTFDFSGATSGGSSSSSSSESTPWWETELDRLKEMFDYNEITLDEYIDGVDGVLSKLQEGSDEWREVNDLLNDLKLDQIEDAYDRGLISLDDYISGLKELQKQYKNSTSAWNDLADSIKEALQEQADMQKDDYDTAHDAAVDLIDKEISKLEELRDAEEEYYDQLIADKEQANDETERELELARLQENLANAQNEKTKRVFREGLGWVYESDQQAIDDAQAELDEFLNQDEISKLEEQKEAALSIFDEQVEAWEDYKESWEDVVDDYETEQARLILAQQLGADAEEDILNQRLDVLEKFKTDYISTLEEIDRLENTSADELSGSVTGSSSSSIGGSSIEGTIAGGNSQSYVVKSGDTLSSIASKYGTTWSKIFEANKDSISNANQIYPGQELSIPGFSNGGVVDFTGLAMLHGTPGKPEYVLNNDQMKNMINSFNRPQIDSLHKNKGESISNYNFGNIELPNVNNARQFMSELKALVNISKNQ